MTDGDLAAGLAAAHAAAAAGRPIVIGWRSRGDGAPLELITTMGGTSGGDQVAAGISRGKHAAPPRISVAPIPEPLSFPPVAWGLPVTDGCADDLDRLVWVPCLAVRDPAPQRPEPASGPSAFETVLVALMRRPFGWLVVAEPAGPAEEAAGLHTEPDGGDGTGLWSVRVLAGASGPDELDVLAPLLAGSVEWGPHPFRLRCDPGAEPLEDALSGRRHDPSDGARSPFLGTAGTFAALAGLPRLGVPGLNVTGSAEPGICPPPSAPAPAPPVSASAPPVPASAPATSAPAPAVPHAPLPPEPPEGDDHQAADLIPDQPPAAIELGIPLDPDPVPGTLRLPVTALGRGVLLTGCAGAGPSPTIAAILGQLTGLGLPWLVVDPAGSGYEKLTSAGALPPVTLINPCAPDAVPLTVSPLAPEPGYPLQAHLDMVRCLIDLSFGSDELFSLALSAALPRVYQAAGWDLLMGGAAGRPPVAPAVPELGQLHTEIINVIGRAGYDRRTRTRLRSLADARFGALLDGAAGRFLHGGHPADVGELLRRNVVLAVHDIGATEDRTFVTGALLIRLAEYLRIRTSRGPGGTSGAASPARLDAPGPLDPPRPPGPPGPRVLLSPSPRHVVVIEEARVILRDLGAGQPATRAAERFAGLLAELGTRGEGFVLAEQRPDLLVPDVARSAAVRIVHRTPPAGRGQAWYWPLGAPEVAVMAADETAPPRWGRILLPPPDPAAPGPAGPAGPAGHGPGEPRPGEVSPSELGRGELGRGELGRGELHPAVLPPLSGRRSVACGRQCREARACRLAELREAELQAASTEHAWLRVWTETFVLAFLTDNPLPAVPAPLRRRWRSLGARSRECLLARVVDHRVRVRAVALRASYDPSRLAQIIASAAVARLDGTGPVAAGTAELTAGCAGMAAGNAGMTAGPGAGVPPAVRPGPAWVVPQLRWLHEIERLCPLGGPGLAPADHAPPLDFDLGLPDWPGIQVGQRVRALRRHPLSMELPGNRRLAWFALAGEDGPGPLAADLGQVMPGVDHAQALRHTAALMEVSGGAGTGPGWLEAVLSWPRRFVAFSGDASPPGDAADCPRG